jgi:MFS family permease
MYITTTQRQARPLSGAALRAVSGTVVTLGLVSLFTDISAEMITAFLPVYTIFTLQMGYVGLGVLDGVYTGATAILSLVGGFLADRVRRHKLVAFTGYGLSAVTKLILPTAGSSTFGLGAILAVDRAGKGLRTAPRDALISLSTPENRQATAFGVHRALDTVGALFGPLVTFGLLSWLGDKGDPIFVVSFLFALVGLVLLGFFVRDRKPGHVPDAGTRPKVSVREAARLLGNRPLRRTAIAAALLGLATISDAFVFVVLQKVSGVPPYFLPLMPLGTALVFMIAAAPVGRLGDRVGSWPVFVAGHVALLGCYLMLLGPVHGAPLVVLTLLLHGAFYAATDGVLSAHAAGLLPAALRGSGLATVQTGQALTRFASAILFGLILTLVTTGSAVLIAAAALAAALLVVGLVLRPLAVRA